MFHPRRGPWAGRNIPLDMRWLLVGIVLGAFGVALAGGEENADYFSYETKAYCDEEFCEDQYVLQCNDMHYTIPTGFRVKLNDDVAPK